MTKEVRQMKPELLANIFSDLSQKKSEELQCDNSREVKKRHETCRMMFFGNLCIELVFRTKGGELCCPCTLFCRIRTNMSKNRFFELTDIADVFGNESFECMIFPYIETETRLAACLDALISRISAILPSIKELSNDETRLKELYARQEIMLSKQFSLKQKHLTFDNPADKEDYLASLCELYETSSYLPAMTTDDAYQAFLSGDRAKAERLIKKKKVPLDFEKRLLKALYDLPPDFVPISDECFARRDYKSALRGKIIGSFILMLPLFSAVYCGAYILLCRLLSRNCIVSLEMPWQTGILLFAAAPALTAALCHYDGISKIFLTKSAKAKLIAFTDITISQKFRTWLNILLTTVLALSAFEVMTFSSTAIRFYDDRLTEPATELPMPWDDVITYRYENAVAIYKYEGLTNEYGDYITRPGYVIVFKDGYFADLDGYADIEIQSHAVSLLEKYCGNAKDIHDRAEAVGVSKSAALK